MGVVRVNGDWNCMEDESAEQSFYPEAPGICDVFRDPELLPRIGDQYQVEIPPLITESAYHLLTESPTDSIMLPGTSHNFLVGLPISLMWINEVVENIKGQPQASPGDLMDNSVRNDPVKSKSIRKMQFFPKGDLKAKIEPVDITMYDGIEVEEPAKLCFQEMDTEMHPTHGRKSYCLAPGSLGEKWFDMEEDSFLLGLYIFGKNLVQVQKFVESKKMGDILSFYYGKFYGSEKYCKWSECRKVRTRRCIYGQRLFTGSRQQELLSRLLPHLSEECQNTFLEAAKAFGEGKMLLEEYVFTLKAAVGLNALVEAVGIGKGKQDLTGISMEHPPKSNQVASVRPEIPIGKACSTLTPLEIINFLTGGYRLSKARSNDLFWEAVWPRLLAKGWHSEQPNDHGFAAASRHSLVFLIPGIKKFSRRKLVKGDHYFDSVSDVLNKVASDTALLQLDVGADEGYGNKEEHGWTKVTNLDQGDLPDQKRHCYLKPRTPSHSSNVKKFTVVDTSLANRETTKVRELRSLPVELMEISASISDSEESDGDSSEESTDESVAAEKPFYNGQSNLKSTKINSDKGVSSERDDFESNTFNKSSTLNGFCFTKVPVKISKDQNANTCNDVQTRKAIKGHAIQRTKLCDRKLLGPVAKQRHRLIACSHMETNCSRVDVFMNPRIEQDEAGCAAGNTDFRQDILFCADLPHEKLSCTTSSRGSPNISEECIYGSNSSSAEHLHEKLQSRTLIDLNIPIPQDVETDPFAVEMTESLQEQTSRPVEDPRSLKTSILVCNSTSGQPSTLNSRRHSTRNRPPTTKALEALACGFLSIRQKRKSRGDFPLDKQMSRPSRRARSRVRVSENLSTGIMDFKGDERGNGGCKSNGDMLSELQV